MHTFLDDGIIHKIVDIFFYFDKHLIFLCIGFYKGHV